mgnify:CR=1 FL=1
MVIGGVDYGPISCNSGGMGCVGYVTQAVRGDSRPNGPLHLAMLAVEFLRLVDIAHNCSAVVLLIQGGAFC